jgi:O-antigen/teichoic acid export membrane protein
MILSFFKNAGFIGATDALLRAKDIIVIPILTKELGPAGFGMWTQIRILVSVCSPLVLLGIDQATMRFLPGATPLEKRRGLGTLTAFILSSSSLVALALFVLDSTITRFFFEETETGFVALCGIVLIVRRMLTMLQNWLRIENAVGAYATINVFRSLAVTVATVSILVTHTGIYELVVAITVLEALLCAALFVLVVRRYGIGAPDTEVLKKHLRYGIPLIPISYAGWMIVSVDRLFINHFHDLASVGVYGMVYSLCFEAFHVFHKPIWIMYPYRASELFNAGNFQGLNTLFSYVSRAAVATMIPIAVGMFVLGETLIRLISTDEFVVGYSILPVVAVAFIAQQLGDYWGISLRLVNKQKLHTAAIVFTAVLNCFLNGLLVPRWGIVGAAWATLVSFVASTIMLAVLANRRLPLHFDLVFLGKVTVAAGFMGCFAHFLNPEGVFFLGATVILSALIYIAGIILLRGLSTSEVSELARVSRLDWLLKWRIVRVAIGLRE